MAAAPAGRRWQAACCFVPRTASTADERQQQQQQALPASQAAAGDVDALPSVTVIVHAPPPPAAKGAAATAACAPSRHATEAEPGTPPPAGRSMGSLTAWQMLAADLAAEGSGSRRGFSAGGELRYLEQQERRQEREGVGGAGGGGGSEGWPPATSSSEAEQGLEALMAGLPFSREGSVFAQLYEVQAALGAGAFGLAVRARRRADGLPVAVKVLATAGMSRRDRRLAKSEVEVLSSLSHPNIVNYHECFSEGGHTFVGGDLECYLRQRGGALLGEGEAMLLFVQGIIHRDIKSSNLFLGAGGVLKLGDFGVSKRVSPEQSCARTMAGTPYYMSPEAVQGRPYNAKTDVWAAGCILYELCALQRPFRGASVSAVVVRVLRGDYALLDSRRYSPELRCLLACLLCRDPGSRPSVDQVLRSDYVRGHLQRYQQHLEACTGARKRSYQAAVQPFLALQEATGGPGQQPRQLACACASSSSSGGGSGAAGAEEAAVLAASESPGCSAVEAAAAAASTLAAERSSAAPPQPSDHAREPVVGIPASASASTSVSASVSTSASAPASASASALASTPASFAASAPASAPAFALASRDSLPLTDAAATTSSAGRVKQLAAMFDHSCAPAAARAAPPGGSGSVARAAHPPPPPSLHIPALAHKESWPGSLGSPQSHFGVAVGLSTDTLTSGGSGGGGSGSCSPRGVAQPRTQAPAALQLLPTPAPLQEQQQQQSEQQHWRDPPPLGKLVQAMPQLLEQIRAIMEAPAATAAAAAPGAGDSSAPGRRRKAMHECLEEMADVCQRVQSLLAPQQI